MCIRDRYRKGQYAETLGPGVYRLWLATTDLKVYDTRETLHDVGSQEIPTKDGVSARFTVALRLRIADPLLIETKVVNCCRPCTRLPNSHCAMAWPPRPSRNCSRTASDSTQT